jgi:hypothetical protein
VDGSEPASLTSVSAPDDVDAQPLLAAAAPKAGKAQVIDTTSPFDHDVHMDSKKVGKGLKCETCHQMTTAEGQCPKTEVRFPKHEACTECHNASFYTPPLTICSNCHKAAQFAAKNPLRELTRQVTPRKAEFSHKSHLDPAGTAVRKMGQKTDCVSCHEMKKGGDVVTHPSHPNCCECHTKPSVQPQMANCGACHSAGRFVQRPPSKIHDFSHKKHREDPRTGNSMQCGQCHVNTQLAVSLRTIRIPEMGTCVQCHNGLGPDVTGPDGLKGAGTFHFSQCLKCHIPGSIQGIPLPPSHPTDTTPPPDTAPETTPPPAPSAPAETPEKK